MTERKTRVRIPKENKVRAELQKEIGSTCPFCENTEVGHFEIHHIDEDPSNNETGNLLLLCPICHSKITKGDISNIEVFKKKIALLKEPIISKPKADKAITFNAKVGNAVVGDNNKISINQPKKTVKQKYPEGCIGFDTVKANYIGHLIKRYNEYKEYEVGKGNVKYGVFGATLKKEFKIGPTRTIYNVPIERFEELYTCIQSRIDKTKLAKVKGVQHKNYSSFEEYVNEVG
ncbi:MAG: HNH endonuclease [Chitinophagales bacterium]|nr:HNH endonuclease [Chitinophagales bacterium]